MRILWRLWLVITLLASLTLANRQIPSVAAQTTDANLAAQAQALLATMTVDERVGQVFLVTFVGDSAPVDSDIASLITEFHIGGVMLDRANDNLTGYGVPDDVPRQVAELSSDLQRLALLGTSNAPLLTADPTLEEGTVPPTRVPSPPTTAVPLLIAINHEGDGYPNSHILNGLTPLPNPMAIGATWNPDFARQIGNIAGSELAALGINMLIGPSLDVLEAPVPFSASDLGTRSFGGDPYWVGVMGQAYTAGVHSGSNGRIAVVPKHFPGNGSSDRPVAIEVPTVRKSLEQLKQIELAPFFAVTSGETPLGGIADALLATHIRYQGFQGNIRATTNPVSFDPQALNTLMALPEFSQWRSSGGLIVSDALGVRSVERFYDVTEQEFPHRRVAKDAFLAGNDLLYLDSFVLGDGPYEVELANIRDTIRWFQEKYVTDQAFQQRVDEAVTRILQLKLRLYGGDLSAENVLVEATAVSPAPGSQTITFDLAQSAITLISPSPTDLAERMPNPPGPTDQIAIFTDLRTVQQCSACAPQPLIGQTALADRILALYGPDASEQILPQQISSHTFADLNDFLNAAGPILLPTPQPTPFPTFTPEVEPTATAEGAATATAVPTATPPPGYNVQQSLRDVDWIIFAMLDGGGSFNALTRFLAERPDLVRDKQVIVFAYNAPYYLDTTEISKLTAYFGVYSKTDAFIDASVRALFQELPLSGASPVSISGVSYDILRQTQPDPNQVIDLFLVGSDPLPEEPGQEPQPLFVGDTLRLQTSVILDKNGNPVPDGTVVGFNQFDRVTGLVNIINEVPTRNGIATLDYVLEARTGQFRITAVAGDATLSREVNIEIRGEAEVAISIPTLAPTPTPTPEPTHTPEPPPTDTPEPPPTSIPQPPAPASEPSINIGLADVNMLLTLFLGLLTIATAAVLTGRRWHISPAARLRWVLWGLLGSLLVYNYFVLGLPGTAVFTTLGSWAGFATALIGGLPGLLIGHRQLPNP